MIKRHCNQFDVSVVMCNVASDNVLLLGMHGIIIIIIILLNNIQNYLLSIHTLYTNSTWGWMLARSVYPPIVLTYYQRFRNYVATPVTIPVRHHLIASSIPTYSRKRKPVILATATPYIATRFVLPLQTLPY